MLVSCDKDFKTIPNCEFYWLTTGEILSHTTAEADYWHMEQTIKGDMTDGYGGIPGYGEDTTRRSLTSRTLRAGDPRAEDWQEQRPAQGRVEEVP
ncbi:exonuclease [Enterobacter phage 03_vB_Eclo_IJM]|nr:exonuclease [Enterobacter phage 03_vB_Eclo_IJM]